MYNNNAFDLVNYPKLSEQICNLYKKMETIQNVHNKVVCMFVHDRERRISGPEIKTLLSLFFINYFDGDLKCRSLIRSY